MFSRHAAQFCFLVSGMFAAANAICKLTKAQVFSGKSSFVSLIIAKTTKARSHKKKTVKRINI